MNTISSFTELLMEIAWSWEYPQYDFIKYKDGYALNKLYITKDEVTYKLERWELAPGVYEEFERFYEFLQSTNE